MTTHYVVLGSEPLPDSDLSHVRVAFGPSSQMVVTIPTKVVGTPDMDTVITMMMESYDRVVDMTQSTE